MNYICSLLSICLVASLTGCLPELPAVSPSSNIVGHKSPDQHFEDFWNGMNNNYAFWDIDPTDWDAVYRTYKPLMAQLKADDEGVRKAHGYYEEMTAQLIDSHYSLTFSNRTLENISPASARLLKRPDFHNHIPPQHYTQTIVGTYLNPSSRLGYSTDSTSIMVAGTIRNTTILYFRIPEFDLQDWYETGTSSQKATIQYVIDQLGQSETTGLIIDVRGNGGGAVADLNFLVGRLVDKPYAYGQYRAKAGPGRLDFLPWVESTVFPPAGSKAFTKPVIVIADMHSVSMSEATAMAVRALPGGNGRVVGERTFGAQAPISPNAAYNAGSFSTGFVRLVYASSMMFRYKDGVCYEGSGFPPDVEAPYDGTSLETGKDTQLEKAISQVR